MAVKDYDSNQITLVVGGVPMGGFGADNKVTISRNNDVTSIIEGVDGVDVTFARSNKKSGTISFDLQYKSEFDTLMDNLASLPTLVPVAFYDSSTLKSLITVGQVMSQPDIALGGEPADRPWTLIVANVDMSVAGKASALLGAVTPFVPV